MTDCKFQVFQAKENSDDFLEGGFKSSRGPTGSFKHTFPHPGRYFFSSGGVDSVGAIVMKGEVVVEEKVTFSESIKMSVEGEY